jgi:hypothetical protein
MKLLLKRFLLKCRNYAKGIFGHKLQKAEVGKQQLILEYRFSFESVINYIDNDRFGTSLNIGQIK